MYVLLATAFKTIELLAFVLPAFPERFEHRLAILWTYGVAHVVGLTSKYAKLKELALDL